MNDLIKILTSDDTTPNALIESLAVTLIRAVREYIKHEGEAFDSGYVTHTPTFYKLDSEGRKQFFRIIEDVLGGQLHIGEGYETTIKGTAEKCFFEDHSKVPSDSDLLGW